MLLFLRDIVEQVSLGTLKSDYDKKFSQDDGTGEDRGRRDEEELDLDKLSRKDLLWAEVVNAGDLTEEWFVVTRTLIIAVGHKGPVPKKIQMELRRSFATEVQSARHEPEVFAREFAYQVAKVRELDLKVRFLADGAGKVGNLRKGCPRGRLGSSPQSRRWKQTKILRRQRFGSVNS